MSKKYIIGVDVSRYQPPAKIDWNKASADGVKFVYVKASEGVDYEDPAFKQHVKNAKAAGLPVGAYHYLRVRSGGRAQDAVKQAEQLCDLVEREDLELIPMLDCEIQGNEAADQYAWDEAITTFLETVEKRLGAKCKLYTYPSFWASKKVLASSDKYASYDLWIAHYTSSPSPIIPAPWKTWKLWQFAASAGNLGKIDGIPGYVDVNRLDGELSELFLEKSNTASQKPKLLTKLSLVSSILRLFKKPT